MIKCFSIKQLKHLKTFEFNLIFKILFSPTPFFQFKCISRAKFQCESNLMPFPVLKMHLENINISLLCFTFEFILCKCLMQKEN